jgi:hypothetical protein
MSDQTSTAGQVGTVGTVGDLMDYLAAQPRNRRIILQKDAEGNGHSPLANAAEAMYAAESAWAGETYLTPEDLAAELARPGTLWTAEDAAPGDAERVVVLGPVN